MLPAASWGDVADRTKRSARYRAQYEDDELEEASLA